MSIETATGIPRDVDNEVLVLTNNELETTVVEREFEGGVEDWHVAVRCLHGDNDHAAGEAEGAISELRPALVLMVGTALAIGEASAGDVVVAECVSALHQRPGPRVTPRRRTRRADPDLARHARDTCGAGRLRFRGGGSGGSGVRVGIVATGSRAVDLCRQDGVSALRASFDEALALDTSGWDFVFGYYDDVDLPAMAIYGLLADASDGHGADEGSRRHACQRAATLAAGVLESVARRGLRLDPLELTAQEGESEHLRGDAELLAHETTQGIVQRPFVFTAQAAQARANRAPRRGKHKVPAAVLNALREPTVVMPPDLSITISLRGNRLAFELHSDRDLPYHRMPVGETELGGSFGATPLEYRDGVKRAVRRIAETPDESDVEELRTLGASLYNDLFPDELKREYANIRGPGVQTLLITSEEPWIPWELVRPHGPDIPDDDFLCTRYAMTRWLTGHHPRRHFRIASIAPLEAGAVPGEEPLESAKGECAYLARLAERCRVENLSPGCASYKTVTALLERSDREVHLWHVAAHGRLGHGDPDESLIVFADRPWRARDLAGVYGYGIQRARPLVFFNACLVGQQDFKLAQLAGWPAAWVVQNRCGGFLAPQWSVKSELAWVFCEAFYDAVAGDEAAGRKGVTLGEAARTARLKVREQAPLDPAWLSYAVYGHPNAGVTFGAPADETEV